ncbi:MAG TPA: hypothetical protein VGM62_08985 [Chthoniobacterales bacterium]
MRRLVPRWLCLATVFVSFLASSSSLQAQMSLVERLSPDTIFCAAWRGTASLSGAEQKNHVLQLLKDPAFAPAWVSLAAALQQRNQKAEDLAAALVFADITSLLENPVVLGVGAVPNGAGSPGPNGQPSRFGFFIVYDATGKAAIIDKWKASSQSSNKTHSQVTTYDFGGTSVEVRAAGARATYSAQTSRYFVASDQKQIVEGLITRFRNADVNPASLGHLTPFRDLQKFIGSDAALEWYARIPDPDQWTIPPSGGKSAAQFAKSIHLEKIHAAGGGVSFAGEAMHVRGAVLGDTSPGGIFDLAGPSTTAFQTEAVVNGSSTFSMSRFNLAALYALAHGAIVGTLSSQQVANVSAVEAVGQVYLGMPIGDALGLMSGEIASFSTYSDDGTAQQAFAATIQQPEAVLRILRAVAGSMIVAEDSSGTATFLDIAYPYKDPKTGTQRRKFYYLAVTPRMLLGAPRKAMLRETVQRLGSNRDALPAAGLLASPDFSRMRSLLPEKLSGLSGSDLTQIPWGNLLSQLEGQITQGAKQKNGQPPPDLSWLKPDAISRHLHIALSGWWKDSGGVYFDSYLQ